MHQAMAYALDTAIAAIKRYQYEARSKVSSDRPRWPVIVLRSPKGLDLTRGLLRKIRLWAYRTPVYYQLSPVAIGRIIEASMSYA